MSHNSQSVETPKYPSTDEQTKYGIAVQRSTVGLYDCWLPHELARGAQRLLPPSPVLGTGFCLPFPFPEPAPRTRPWDGDVALRTPARCVPDWAWLGPLSELRRFGGQVWGPSHIAAAQDSTHVSLPFAVGRTATCPPAGAHSSLRSLPALCVQQPVSDHTQEAPRRVTNPQTCYSRDQHLKHYSKWKKPDPEGPIL